MYYPSPPCNPRVSRSGHGDGARAEPAAAGEGAARRGLESTFGAAGPAASAVREWDAFEGAAGLSGGNLGSPSREGPLGGDEGTAETPRKSNPGSSQRHGTPASTSSSSDGDSDGGGDGDGRGSDA
jgi:hypothetical protein